MKLTDRNVLDTGQRVQALLDSQSATFGTAVPAPLRAQLDTATAQLAAAQQNQESFTSAAVGEKANQDAIRKELKSDFVRPMARIARHAMRTSPDFQALVVSARVTRRGEFLIKVNSMADAAAKHEQEFVDHGMPADFIAQLRGAVTRLTASVETRGKQLGGRSQSVKSIEVATKAVRDVLHVMDGTMRRELKKNQPLLANWVATSRIQATVVTPLPTGDLSAVTSAPQPSAAAVTAPATPAA